MIKLLPKLGIVKLKTSKKERELGALRILTTQARDLGSEQRPPADLRQHEGHARNVVGEIELSLFARF